MTAIMMATMGAAAITVARLDTTITVGSIDYIDVGTEDTFFAFGYNADLADPIGLGPFGSMGDDTYIDGSTVSRTINSVYWTEPNGGAAPTIDDNLYFGLDTTSVPDTDLTFKEIEYNGVIYTRASADVYTADVSSATTFWQWNNVSPNPPTSGTRDFKVRL